MIVTMTGYEIDDDPARVDRDAVRHLLATEAYWGRWRAGEHVEQQIAGAWRVTGAYDRAGRTVGFARAISDGVALAYLADVIVDPAARGHGLGVALVQLMIDDGPGRDFRWTLHTADAHTLYARFGSPRRMRRTWSGRPDESGAEHNGRTPHSARISCAAARDVGQRRPHHRQEPA